MGMEMNICSLAPYFHDEAAAWELMESLRWPSGPECPHCGAVDNATFLKPRDGQRTTSAGNVSFRRTWKCRECHKKFSVLVGSIFENSRVPLTKWLYALYMMCANKNGVAAFEIHRTLHVTQKTAWFMMHRIREATKSGPLADMFRGTIVADETWIGGEPKNMHASKRGPSHRGRPKDARFYPDRQRDWRGPFPRHALGHREHAQQGNGRAGGHGREHPLHRPGAALRQHRQAVRRPRIGQPLNRGVRPRAGHHEVQRGTSVAQDFDNGNPPRRQPQAPAPLPGRVRLPLLDLQDVGLGPYGPAISQTGGKRLTYRTVKREMV